MHKGFIQLGNLIFIVLFVVMVFAASYLYFFSDDSKKVISGVSAANIEQKATISFVHPAYFYSLDLPYNWRGKYQTTESESQTNFWYLDDSGKSDLLFSIKRQLAGESVSLTGENKKLFQTDDFLYVLNIPDRVTEALDSLNSQMRREVFSIGETFLLLNKNPSDLAISNALLDGLTTSSSSLKFSAFEIIATQENSSTTEYYIWFYRRSFMWDGFRLRDWPIESHPAAVIISKDNKPISLRVPRSGANMNSDVKKIFPSSVRGSAIFMDTSAEHEIMLNKLSDRLNEMVTLYFGSEPVLTRAGFIDEIKPSQGGVDAKVFLAESVRLSATSTYTISNINKIADRIFISSSTPPLGLPATTVKNKFGVIISSTTPQVLLLSEWQKIFNKTSTSTWRKKPFWFEIKNGEILKISPL